MSDWVDITSDAHWTRFPSHGTWTGTQWVFEEFIPEELVPKEDGFFSDPVEISGLRVTGTSTADDDPTADTQLTLYVAVGGDSTDYFFTALLSQTPTVSELIIPDGTLLLNYDPEEGDFFKIQIQHGANWWEYPQLVITKIEVLVGEAEPTIDAKWTDHVNTAERCTE